MASPARSTWATPRTLAAIATICSQTLCVLFVDTGALFAFLVRNDVHHSDAVRAEAEIRSRREQVWTIDAVLTELWLLLRGEIGLDRSDAMVAGVLDRGVRREALEDRDFTRRGSSGVNVRIRTSHLVTDRRSRFWNVPVGNAPGPTIVTSLSFVSVRRGTARSISFAEECQHPPGLRLVPTEPVSDCGRYFTTLPSLNVGSPGFPGPNVFTI